MDKGEKKEKRDIRERLCHALDIHPDILPGESVVEIRGQCQVTVRGSGKMLTYTDRIIRMKLGGSVLRIEGRRLCCTAYHPGASVIDGKICSAVFEEQV